MPSIAASQSQPKIIPKTTPLHRVKLGACVKTSGDSSLIAILLSKSPGACHVRVIGRTEKVHGESFPYEIHWAPETEVVAAESSRQVDAQAKASAAPFGQGPRLNGVLVHYLDYPHIPSIRSTWTQDRVYPYANRRKALGMKGSYDPSDCKVIDWGKHQKPEGV